MYCCSASKHAVSRILSISDGNMQYSSIWCHIYKLMSMLTESCSTVGSRSQPCIFPFKYAGAEYSACTARDSDTGQPWCATEVRSSVSCYELTFSTRWTLRAGWWTTPGVTATPAALEHVSGHQGEYYSAERNDYLSEVLEEYSPLLAQDTAFADMSEM